MAIVSNAELWTGIVNSIRLAFPEIHPQSDRYFNGYTYSSPNPLVNVYPIITNGSFFGTRTFNIVIVGQPFGWTNSGGDWVFSWPPSGYADSLKAIRDNFEQWSKYKTVMYGDQWLVQKAINADPIGGAIFSDMMQETFAKLEEECLANADIGLEWKGTIDTEVSAEYFYPAIEEFLIDDTEE